MRAALSAGAVMVGGRIGIGFGASKIEVATLASDGSLPLCRRVPTPAAYADALPAIAGLIRQAEAETGTASACPGGSTRRWRSCPPATA